MFVRCCKGCVPPKRHLRCHATCKDYIEEKARNEAIIQKNKGKLDNSVYEFDLNGTAYIDSARHCKGRSRRKGKRI